MGQKVLFICLRFSLNVIWVKFSWHFARETTDYQLKLVDGGVFLLGKESVIFKDIGDEYHMTLVCEKVKIDRRKYVKPYYYRNPNI